jgi:hypothetical protein
MFYFGTIVKNYEPHFQHFEQFISEIRNRIPNCCMCIYEDSSTDATPTLLQQIKDKYQLYILSEQFDWNRKGTVFARSNKQPCRIECISNARNQLLTLLESHGMGEHSDDICIMVDTDFRRSPDVSMIVHWATHFPEEVDALFANGKDGNGNYYDSFAFRDSTFFFDNDMYGDIEFTLIDHDKYHAKHNFCQRTLGTILSSGRYPVISAFAGIGIYRGTSIRGLRYAHYVTPAVEQFYLQFMKEHPEHEFVKIIQSLQLIKTDYNLTLYSDLSYYQSCGYAYPIVCEHVPFHIGMIQRGKGRLFIEPSLHYYW